MTIVKRHFRRTISDEDFEVMNDVGCFDDADGSPESLGLTKVRQHTRRPVEPFEYLWED